MARKKNSRLNWSQYTWEEFEDICYEYASIKYNSDIYEVSITERRKDGGRDIIITDLVNTKVTWGECKHHKNSVGLDSIGKNVVLAITNQLNKIIFFSVSSVTPNTKHEILCAAKIHGFDVLFLDGTELDREIAGNKQLLNKYFKESFELFNPNTNTLVIDVCIDEFENAYNDTFYSDSKYYRLENGLDFYVHIFLKNCYSLNIDSIQINIPQQTDCHFYTLNESIDKLNSFCDTVLTLHGIALNAQQVISLPQITINYLLNQETKHSFIELGELDSKGICKIPLSGSHNIEYLASIDSLRKQVINGHTRIIYLRGISGSGKTRMLEEISSLMIQRAFMPVYIDALKYKKNFLFREMIRQLLCIPHLNSQNSFEEHEFEILLNKYHISFPDITSIYKFIWGKKNISATILGDFIYQCITKAPVTSKLYIQIDNIQSMDEETQGSILFLCSKIIKEKSHVCFAFTLNTSYARISNKTPLVQYLENQRFHEDNPVMLPHTMKKLDEASRQYIVKECLHMSDSYEKEIAEIANQSGALPLDILLFCKMLCNSNCFIWNDNMREIQDPEKFSENLSMLPNAISSIIQIRLDAIYEVYPNKKNIRKLFQLILFFTNRLPFKIADSFGISKELISKLKEDLIIVQDSDAYISFFHDNYYRYFLKHGEEYCFNSRELSKLLKFSEEYVDELGPTMAVNQVKCLYLLNKKDDFQQLAKKLLYEFKALGFYAEIVTLSSFYLSKTRAQQYQNDRLLFLIEKAVAQLEAVSFVQGINTLKDIETKIKSMKFIYDNQLVGKFYHQFVNSYTHAGKYHFALDVLHNFETMEQLNYQQKFLIEDRYCLCYYALGNLNMSERHIKKALKIAQKMESNFWVSTAYSDRAFSYLINTVDISKMKYYFRKAIKSYDKETDSSEYRSIEIEIQSALLALLENKYNKADLHINSAITQAIERTYTYLLIPAYNVKAFILLKKRKIKEAITVLEQARLNSEIFGVTKYMITIWNSLGIAYCAEKNCTKSQECFTIAEKTLRAYSNADDCSVRYAPLIANWLFSSFQNDPNIIRKNKSYYQYYNSERINVILNQLLDNQIENPSIILAEHFPLTHDGYAMMY